MLMSTGSKLEPSLSHDFEQCDADGRPGDIADRLELRERNDPKLDVLRLVSNWLCDETNWRWMMILDNADDT
jgi:hypothetical protein